MKNSLKTLTNYLSEYIKDMIKSTKKTEYPIIKLVNIPEHFRNSIKGDKVSVKFIGGKRLDGMVLQNDAVRNVSMLMRPDSKTMLKIDYKFEEGINGLRLSNINGISYLWPGFGFYKYHWIMKRYNQ